MNGLRAVYRTRKMRGYSLGCFLFTDATPIHSRPSQSSMLQIHFSGKLSVFTPGGRSLHFSHLSQQTHSSLTTGTTVDTAALDSGPLPIVDEDGF
ncbi:hypothetical protein HanXRQr2_Chr10g0425461 [Helianthus annuus]|uniref:Uncharacterized protein n=1 Tax=Helianthus annuus TaxID=4232 RepID=A0A9K3HVZ4_HELAN|nr:hypothetical protein HanXRQr2_Chr10g0425461 [Helianthus annuus]